MSQRCLVAAGAALLLVLQSAAGAWEIPLVVDKPMQGAMPPFVSGGVPLLPGQARETADLRLAVKDSGGKLAAIPAQFRVLARWWQGDPSTGSGPGGKSIRWVLVDFATADVPGEKKMVVLTDAKLDAAKPKAPAAAEDTGEAVVVSTGAAKFTVSKKKFSFLQSAVVDGEELLDSSADLGTVIEDTFGEKYYASEGTKTVEVLESGPVRVCVRARGQHLARGGKGYSRGMYGYDVFLNFYAGSADVYADVIVTNNFQKSIGSPTIEDASLLLKLKGGAGSCALWGDKGPTEAKPAAGESVCLYQDSNGADSWEKCPGFGDMKADGWSPLATKITSFRGYKVLKRAAGKEEELGTGNQASGLLSAASDRGGVVVHTRNFWQQFPKAAEVAGDGTVRLGLFPRECAVPHYLEDASAKGHEIVLRFHSAKSGRPKPEAVAEAWAAPALPRSPLEHQAACGALADLGPFTVPTGGLGEKPNDKTAIDSKRALTGDELYGNAYGWQVFGERWRSNGGHSTHGARQPIKEDCYLFRWNLAGAPEWLALGDARSRQFRDVRAFRVDDQDAMGFKTWKEFQGGNTREHGNTRPLPRDEELKKHQAGFWPRSPWEFPNREHTTVDLLYDRYLLMGDQRAFENMRVAAAHGVFYVIGSSSADPKSWSFVNRDIGWSWRAFDRYWELTGDERAGELYKELIKAEARKIGKAPLVMAGSKPADKNGLTHIWCHALAMGALHTRDPQLVELARTAAEGKEECGDYFYDLFAVLYHLTGDAKYKEMVTKKMDEARLLKASIGEHEYFPPAIHWLLNQPPKTQK
ncbi:MAG TPA: hypothetical protein PK280_11405 [Planctomycetota bacterium]|nr:hypothetical protein [Planctomycetota bacterium]